MKYKKINYIQNRNRIKTLNEFISLINIYFENISVNYRNLSENDLAQNTRSKINLMTAKVTRYLEDSRVPTTVYYSPPPAIGGLCGDIDILGNIFQAHIFGFRKDIVIDMLEKSIGIYKDDKIFSLIRTFNPLFWLNKIFIYIAKLPFQLLKSVNLNIKEDSVWTKLLTLLFYLLQVIGILFPIALYYNIL